MKTIVAVALLCLATNASALTAFLQSCRFGQSVTYQSVYIGIYMVNGQTFEKTFPSSVGWCPQTIDVY